MSTIKSYKEPHSLTIRGADPTDAATIRRLAELEGDRTPLAPALIAEVDGEAVAAMSIPEGRVVADPFRPTGHARRMLIEQATWEHRGAEASHRLTRGLPGRSAPWPA